MIFTCIEGLITKPRKESGLIRAIILAVRLRTIGELNVLEIRKAVIPRFSEVGV
jgi:hypothetical protein